MHTSSTKSSSTYRKTSQDTTSTTAAMEPSEPEREEPEQLHLLHTQQHFSFSSCGGSGSICGLMKAKSEVVGVQQRGVARGGSAAAGVVAH